MTRNTVAAQDGGKSSPAKARRRFGDHLQNGVQIEGRAADGLQQISRRIEIFSRFVTFYRALVELTLEVGVFAPKSGHNVQCRGHIARTA